MIPRQFKYKLFVEFFNNFLFSKDVFDEFSFQKDEFLSNEHDVKTKTINKIKNFTLDP